MDGGEPGAGTEIKVNGKTVPSKGTVRLKQGDVLTVLSPGGGYGAAV
jgi:N-methylhydantoinase B/oxoprolinase/acetone carboxylase alpha subunit